MKKLPTFDSEEMQALRERNEQRVKQFRQQMGENWLCHPSNSSQRKQQQFVLT